MPLDRAEIRQVLESARREGLVSEVPDQQDGYGEEVTGQWTVSEKGQKLNRPRTLALPDLGYLILGEHDRWVKTFDMVKTAVAAAIPVAALVGIKQLDPSESTKWVGFAAAGVVIFCWIAYGLKGELDLRAAADSWPRLKKERHERLEYQKSLPCTICLPAFVFLLYAGAGLWLGLGLFDWWVYTLAGVAAVAFYFSCVFPKYRAWHRIDPGRCRAVWRRRGKDAAEAALAEPPSSGPGA